MDSAQAPRRSSNGAGEPDGRRHRRRRGRRVRLRPRGARLARGAGAHPRVRLHRGRARRRRQRREQRCRAGRPGESGWRRRTRRARPSSVGGASSRASASAASFARPRGAHRSRRASWPEAFTPPSSRSCASIAPSATRSIATRGPGSSATRSRPRSTADAVLVSDYGSGLVTPALVSKIVKALRQKGRPIPVLIDTRYRLLDYRGLTACTPNESEVEQALGVRINDSLRCSSAPAATVLERTRHEGGAHHPRQPRHGAVRAEDADGAHSRSSAPTRSPTSPAPATR